jgi:hypothetical protein
VNWGTGDFLNLARTASDPSGLAWYSILLGYPVLGIWYWCCDQTIVQRVLAAKDERHARLGPLFCAFLKIFPVFVFVLPGVICVALVQQDAFGGDAPLTSADTSTFMIEGYLDEIHPLGYCPEGDAIADACVFLLSDKARFVTGHIMHVSGGAELGYRRPVEEPRVEPA